MLVLPSVTAPAASRRATAVASYGAMKLSSIFEPQLVRTPRRAEDVFVRDRQPGQRRRGSGAQLRIGSGSLRQRTFARHGDEAVVLRVEALDAVEIEARQLDAGELPAPESVGQVGEGRERIHHSTTRGTRYRPSRTDGAILLECVAVDSLGHFVGSQALCRIERMGERFDGVGGDT